MVQANSQTLQAHSQTIDVLVSEKSELLTQLAASQQDAETSKSEASPCCGVCVTVM